MSTWDELFARIDKLEEAIKVRHPKRPKPRNPRRDPARAEFELLCSALQTRKLILREWFYFRSSEFAKMPGATPTQIYTLWSFYNRRTPESCK